MCGEWGCLSSESNSDGGLVDGWCEIDETFIEHCEGRIVGGKSKHYDLTRLAEYRWEMEFMLSFLNIRMRSDGLDA